MEALLTLAMLGRLHTRLAMASIAVVLLNDLAAAMELRIGSRVPVTQSKKIVIKNDGGVRNATNTFAFGDTCYSKHDPKTWFIVRRIVGDQALVEVECTPIVFGLTCPDGTETSRPVIELEARLDAYAKEVDTQLFEKMQLGTVMPVQ